MVTVCVYCMQYFLLVFICRVRRARDRMVVGFTTSCAINVCHQRKFWVRIPLMAKCTRYNWFVMKYFSDFGSCSWSYGRWIYNFLCNQRLPPSSQFKSRSWRSVLDTTFMWWSFSVTSGPEPTIYRTRSERTNHYITHDMFG